MCKELEHIAPSTYYEHKACERDPQRRPRRVQRDAQLSAEIERVWTENMKVYGVRKVWPQLNREGYPVARCTVGRMMRTLGLPGVRRGAGVRTTVPCKDCLPEDHVIRDFSASRPNALWLSDFTYVRTQKGFVYVAFVIDAYARRIMGWRVSRSMKTDFVLDALEQALHERCDVPGEALLHHNDRGVQYVSFRYTTRLEQAGIQPSVGSVGDSYGNALAESINGLYKAETIHRKSTWLDIKAVEMATLTWVSWFNSKRILEPLGYQSPMEFEREYYQP
jgi:putative transposase